MEEWRDIPGYEGSYQVSDLGRVKSLARIILRNDGTTDPKKDRILIHSTKPNKYPHVYLCGIGKPKHHSIHRLVAIVFVENTLCLPNVNHKNSDKHDNKAENLEWVTQRENVVHGFSKKDKSSKYPGVRKQGNAWRASIRLKNNRYFLGPFLSEIDAHNAYKKELEKNDIVNRYANVE